MNVLTREVAQEVDQNEGKLTRTAFSRLLEWLDDGVNSNGDVYVEMRRRLVAYFDRRSRHNADELADETFNRIAATLAQSGSIAVTPPAKYCYVVARFVLLEDLRRARRYVPVDEGRPRLLRVPDRAIAADDDAHAVQERRLECLDRCLLKLKPDQRQLAVEYYHDAKRRRIDRRKDLAARLGITLNALGIRACRIRTILEGCVDECCKGSEGFRRLVSYRSASSGKDT